MVLLYIVPNIVDFNVASVFAQLLDNNTELDGETLSLRSQLVEYCVQQTHEILLTDNFSTPEITKRARFLTKGM